jgi:hypothetical protein
MTRLGPHERARESERGASAVVWLLAAIGCVLIVSAGVIAFRGFHYRQFDCGSVMSTRDPRAFVAKRLVVPTSYETAHEQCEAERSTKSTQARAALIAGTVLLLGALAAPAMSRRSVRLHRRRARH